MAEVNPAEISAILKQQLSNHDANISFDEIGTVLTIGDGIARVYGLSNVQYGELVQFEGDLEGIVLNLEEDNVGIVLLGASNDIKEGDTVKRTNRIAEISSRRNCWKSGEHTRTTNRWKRTDRRRAI